MKLFAAAGGLLALCLVASPALAQSILTGVVRDARTGRALAGAEVAVSNHTLQARTGANGRFSLDGIGAGRVGIVVRMLGFDSVSVVIPFSGADTVRRDFGLTSIGQPLPAVPVTAASEPFTSAKLREFERRRAMGFGRFITPDELENQRHRKMSEIVQQLPGVIIARPRGGRFASGAFVVNSSSETSIALQSAAFGRNCPVAIWIDGVAVYRGLDRTSKSAFGGERAPGQLAEPPFDINSISMMTVDAIEYYPGPASMPPELNATGQTCGAMVIWTR